MQWIPETLKHLSVSKIFASALFLGSGVLLFGPYALPAQIPELDGNLKTAAIFSIVFTGTYILAWILGFLWKQLCSAWQMLMYWWRDKELTPFDRVFIELIASQPGQALNLNHLEYGHGQISLLETIQHGKSLAARGLVRAGPFDDTIFTLTERGKSVGARILAENRARKNNA